jgi:hypothetical protein
MARLSSILAVGAALAGLAMGRRMNTRRPYNTDMYDCKWNPLGTPVPDENTFQLALEGYRQTRSYPLCVDGDDVNCTNPIAVNFDFLNKGLVFAFSAYQGMAYTDISVSIDNDAGWAHKTWSMTDSECAASVDSTTVTCTFPYGNDNITAMCPNGDSEALTLNWEMSAQLKDSTGGVHYARDKASCNDYPTCKNVSPSKFWALHYRCTKCPNTGLTSSAPNSATPSPTSSKPGWTTSTPATKQTTPTTPATKTKPTGCPECVPKTEYKTKYKTKTEVKTEVKTETKTEPRESNPIFCNFSTGLALFHGHQRRLTNASRRLLHHYRDEGEREGVDNHCHRDEDEGGLP